MYSDFPCKCFRLHLPVLLCSNAYIYHPLPKTNPLTLFFARPSRPQQRLRKPHPKSLIIPICHHLRRVEGVLNLPPIQFVPSQSLQFCIRERANAHIRVLGLRTATQKRGTHVLAASFGQMGTVEREEKIATSLLRPTSRVPHNSNHQAPTRTRIIPPKSASEPDCFRPMRFSDTAQKQIPPVNPRKQARGPALEHELPYHRATLIHLEVTFPHDEQPLSVRH
jgi:hypothetical protein